MGLGIPKVDYFMGAWVRVGDVETPSLFFFFPDKSTYEAWL